MPETITPSSITMDSTMLAAYIATAVSFLTLSITIWREGHVKRKERKRHTDDLLRYLSSLVHGAVKQAIFHIKSIKTYGEALDKDCYNYAPLHMAPKPDLEAIATKLTEEQYFNCYVDKYKDIAGNVEEIKVIFSSATFINGQLGRLLDMSNLYYSEETKKRQIVSEAIQEIMQTVFELQSKLGTKNIEFNKFFHFATNTLENYNQKRTSATNIEESYNLFILPFVVATQNEFANVTAIAPLINPLRAAKNNYHAIKIHCHSYLQEIRVMHEGLIEATKSMREAATHLVQDYPIIPIREGRQTSSSVTGESLAEAPSWP